jgi:hypothetical protein
VRKKVSKMRTPKEVMGKAITAVKNKSRKGSRVIARSLVTLKDRAAANMMAFRRAHKNK